MCHFRYDLDFKTKGAKKDASLMLTGDELMQFYQNMIAKYPIVTIEDPFDQVSSTSFNFFYVRSFDSDGFTPACSCPAL